jgi:hypothetical protein
MSWEIDYLVRQEQYQDLMRQAERDWLCEAVRRQNSQPPLFRQVAGWLGAQMVKWGAALQNYATSPSANISQVTIQTE